MELLTFTLAKYSFLQIKLGESALMIFAEKGYADVVTHLIEFKADVNTINMVNSLDTQKFWFNFNVCWLIQNLKMDSFFYRASVMI